MMNETSCQCEHCRTMCATAACLPTPDEARTLIRRGYGPRLSVYNFAPEQFEPQRYVMPSPAAREGQDIALEAPQGPCTFFKDGACGLHDLGLKPLEGRLANHATDGRATRIHVLRAWSGKRPDSVVAALRRVHELQSETT